MNNVMLAKDSISAALAQIKVEMINHNNVNNDMDLDGMAEHLRSKIEEEMNAAAEGEH